MRTAICSFLILLIKVFVIMTPSQFFGFSLLFIASFALCFTQDLAELGMYK